jgi:hypothetical protein
MRGKRWYFRFTVSVVPVVDLAVAFHCTEYDSKRAGQTLFSYPFAFLVPSSCRRKSQLSLENKLLVYKVILKPVWTYGIQLWGIASNSNLEILERFQSKVLRIITDLQIPTVKKEARKYNANHRKRLDAHPNNLANALFKEQLGIRRLKRLYPADLVTNG